MEMKKVQLGNGETIAYRERTGKTDPVLLIHGNMTSSKHWDLVLEEMDPKYHLLAVDLRGFGESSYHVPFDSLDELAEDIKETLDIIGVPSVHVVGWSTGGGVAMKLAALYPETVRSMTLLCSLSTRGYPHVLLNEDWKPIKRSATKEDVEQDIWRTLPITKAYREKDGEFLKGIWNQLIYTVNRPDAVRYEEYVEDMCTQRNLVDIYHANNHFNISEEGTGEIRKIKAPILILQGERDMVVSNDMIQEIREDFGDQASYHLLKGCGHSPLIDDLPQLLDVMGRFIDQHRKK
ncbi:intracellular short-chain-length polyhydroxyalkanoate depolymerase [Evansella vedderi]|uniref:intracellular short-chain-length polyhydroxyalkanoate depolymerase n=1 Tax=Evansella vedderi TaxID=38282 RepID=UPI0027D8A224|nr:alpha/beta hydrolase [Evansella vedderi]